MTPTVPISEMTQLLADSEGSAIQRQDLETTENPLLADAEEEELAQLWAADTGNQGA